MNKVRLGVNLDHVATVRQVRDTLYPDFLHSIKVAEDAGADGITIHLREDRRHIQDEDVYVAREAVTTTLNLEMAATDEMKCIALDVKPNFCCIVPERRKELTTEGGLDVFKNMAQLKDICQTLMDSNIQVSLFIEPDKQVVDGAFQIGASLVELHTGKYANATGEDIKHELQRIIDVAQYATQLGLTVNAGHGLHRGNVLAIATIKEINELNIGHAIVSDAIFMGLAAAVAAMKASMQGK